MWDYVHLVVYSGVPFVLMVLFNSGVVYHLLPCPTPIHAEEVVHPTSSNLDHTGRDDVALLDLIDSIGYYLRILLPKSRTYVVKAGR